MDRLFTKESDGKHISFYDITQGMKFKYADYKAGRIVFESKWLIAETIPITTENGLAVTVSVAGKLFSLARVYKYHNQDEDQSFLRYSNSDTSPETILKFIVSKDDFEDFLATIRYSFTYWPGWTKIGIKVEKGYLFFAENQVYPYRKSNPCWEIINGHYISFTIELGVVTQGTLSDLSNIDEYTFFECIYPLRTKGYVKKVKDDYVVTIVQNKL
jgi:hypothetical protein